MATPFAQDRLTRRVGLAAVAGVSLLGVALATAFAYAAWTATLGAGRERFLRANDRLVAEARRRLLLPEYGLRGARGALIANQQLQRADFVRYFESRDLPREFPGVRGIGVIECTEREHLEDFLSRQRVVGGWPIGTTVEAMRAHHLRHHARTNAPNDPYLVPRRALGDVKLFVVLLGVFPFWVVRAFIGVGSLVFPCLTKTYAALLVSGEDDAAARRDVERARRVEWPVALSWTLLLALTAFAPLPLLHHWWLPLGWTALFNACRFLAEHTVAPAEAGLDETTREFTTRWLSPFVFPHHVGLHRTHHRFPTASWETLPSLRR